MLDNVVIMLVMKWVFGEDVGDEVVVIGADVDEVVVTVEHRFRNQWYHISHDQCYHISLHHIDISPCCDMDMIFHEMN